MKLIAWQYCKDPNEINDAIKNRDGDWDGLESADQIVSISWDSHQGCYAVFWTAERRESCWR